MTELGYQAASAAGFGLASWASFFAESNETNKKLIWPQSINEFDQMRREDPQVASVIRAVTLPILRTEWVLDGEGCRDEVVDLIATDIGLPVKGQTTTARRRTKGRFSWAEHLRLALLEITYGHSVFEQVYDQSTGRTRLAKLAWRPPRTIAKFEVAKDGGLDAITQHAAEGGKDVRIPVDRLVVYVNEREGGNWVGLSLLRSAHRMWVLKGRALRIQVLAAERNGLGIPVYTGADHSGVEDPETREKREAEDLAAGLRIARGFRAGDTAGASIAFGADLELVGITGKTIDVDTQLRYYDEQIGHAVLAHFLSLGGDNSTGSYALGDTFASFFTDSLNAVCQHIADVFNQHVIEDLVDRNWGEDEPAPRIVPAPIGAEHAATSEAIRALLESGAIKADPALEAHLRALYKLPLKAEGDQSGTDDDAAQARNAAETAQKVYLATDEEPLTLPEARDLIRRAGARIPGGASTSASTSDPSEESA